MPSPCSARRPWPTGQSAAETGYCTCAFERVLPVMFVGSIAVQSVPHIQKNRLFQIGTLKWVLRRLEVVFMLSVAYIWRTLYPKLKLPCACTADAKFWALSLQ